MESVATEYASLFIEASRPTVTCQFTVFSGNLVLRIRSNGTRIRSITVILIQQGVESETMHDPLNIAPSGSEDTVLVTL